MWICFINLYVRPFFDESSCHLGLRYLVNLKTNPAPSSIGWIGNLNENCHVRYTTYTLLNENEQKQHKIAASKETPFPKQDV